MRMRAPPLSSDWSELSPLMSSACYYESDSSQVVFGKFLAPANRVLLAIGHRHPNKATPSTIHKNLRHRPHWQSTKLRGVRTKFPQSELCTWSSQACSFELNQPFHPGSMAEFSCSFSRQCCLEDLPQTRFRSGGYDPLKLRFSQIP